MRVFLIALGRFACGQEDQSRSGFEVHQPFNYLIIGLGIRAAVFIFKVERSRARPHYLPLELDFVPFENSVTEVMQDVMLAESDLNRVERGRPFNEADLP